jgi:dihydroorotase
VDLTRAIELLSSGPARLLGAGGSLGSGARADVVVFDPRVSWMVDRDRMHSKSRNTPFHGRELRGRVQHVFSAGRHVLVEGELVERVPA